MKLYRMHDAAPAGVFECSEREAHTWNEKGFGIFYSVNEFNGPRRISNLTKINAWFIDIDHGTKEEQLELIGSGPIPSVLVETKRGYQALWRTVDATIDNWNPIMRDRVIPFYGADLNARDPARILRAPGFNHLKDPANPFLVKKIVDLPTVAYSEKYFLSRFKDVSEAAKQTYMADQSERESVAHSNLWDALFHADQGELLSRFSGHQLVKQEEFTFRRVRNGNHNIFVNGKGTSCWLDGARRIGSHSKGGPTIFQWLRWYGNSKHAVIQALKEKCPELPWTN